jgi:large subunit ribosomal protein L10
MKSKTVAQIPEKKINVLNELCELIKSKKAILIASISNLPASQFQEISKKLRGKAVIKIPKKNLMFRAIEDSGDEILKKIKDQIKENVAILFSDLDCFDLSLELLENKSLAKAKAGQEAPEDIQVQAGPTDLIPGPAISELGALGIQIQIEKGKIHIKEPKVIVKGGTKISKGAADVMNKLDIKPFSIGLVPLSGFDVENKKLYIEIKIDKEEVLKDLKESFSRALPFAVSVGYICHDSVKFLIGKAGLHEKALEKIFEGSAENLEKDLKKENHISEESKESSKTS